MADVAASDASYLSWFAQNITPDNSERAALVRACQDALRDSGVKRELQAFRGNLTDRVKELALWTEAGRRRVLGGAFGLSLVPHQFPDISCALALADVHRIHGATAGCFVDYLLRRIICEHVGRRPFDFRAEQEIRGLIYDTDAILRRSGLARKSDNGGAGGTEEGAGGAEGAEGAGGAEGAEDAEGVVATVEHPDGHWAFVKEHALDAAYAAYKDLSRKTPDILREICLTSWAHRLAFGDFRLDTAKRVLIAADGVRGAVGALLSALVDAYPLGDVALNPTLGLRGMGADADLIAGDVLVDFKLSAHPPAPHDLLQLLGYAALAQEHYGRFIRRVSIFNPLRATRYDCDISAWDAASRRAMLGHLVPPRPPRGDRAPPRD